MGGIKTYMTIKKYVWVDIYFIKNFNSIKKRIVVKDNLFSWFDENIGTGGKCYVPNIRTWVGIKIYLISFNPYNIIILFYCYYDKYCVLL